MERFFSSRKTEKGKKKGQARREKRGPVPLSIVRGKEGSCVICILRREERKNAPDEKEKGARRLSLASPGLLGRKEGASRHCINGRPRKKKEKKRERTKKRRVRGRIRIDGSGHQVGKERRQGDCPAHTNKKGKKKKGETMVAIERGKKKQRGRMKRGDSATEYVQKRKRGASGGFFFS